MFWTSSDQWHVFERRQTHEMFLTLSNEKVPTESRYTVLNDKIISTTMQLSRKGLLYSVHLISVIAIQYAGLAMVNENVCSSRQLLPSTLSI